MITLAEAPSYLASATAAVWGTDDIVQLVERMVDWQRLRVKHIQASRVNAAFDQSLGNWH